MSQDVTERSVPPVLWPDGGAQPETHTEVLDPYTGRRVWVVRQYAAEWVRRRLDKKLSEQINDVRPRRAGRR
jgi:hypothetical protein